MAYDGVLDDIRTIIELGTPRRVPVFAMSEEFDVRWYGRGTYQEITSDASKLAACWIAAIREFDYDWAWLQIDDCIEFEPLGVGVRGEGNILPATCDYLPATRETLRSLRRPDPRRDGRMPVLLDAISMIREELGDSVCVCGRVAAPFSSTALLYGIEETMMLIITDPDLIHETNEFFVEMQAEFGRAQYEAGAHALWVGDCNAMSNLISLKHYTEFAFEPCRKLVRALRDIGVITMLHNSEIRIPYIEKEAELGVDVVSIGPEGHLAAAKRALSGKVALMGNLDPVNVLQNGTPEQVAEETRRLMEVGRPGGAYIFDTGEMVPRETPEENMRAMMRVAKELA